jgi:hypothetical protein
LFEGDLSDLSRAMSYSTMGDRPDTWRDYSSIA